MVTIKRGFSAEKKIGGFFVSTHQFEVVNEGGEDFRIDVGHLAGSKKVIFSISTGGQVVKVGTGYLNTLEIFRIAKGLINGSEPVGEIKLERI